MSKNEAATANEPILPDDYPMHWMYIYLVNGRLFRNKLPWNTVAELKRYFEDAGEGTPTVQRCDVVARGLSHLLI